MAELRLPGRAGEEVSDRRRGGSCGRCPLACSKWRRALGIPIESNGDLLVPHGIAVRNYYCSLQPLLFFFASVWPVWMFRMLLLCSITPCPDSGLLEGAKMKKETVF